MKLEDCFNEKGDFKDFFDPYRDHDHEFKKFLFDDGNLRDELWSDLKTFINKNNFHFTCDAISLYHADMHGGNTKGSYPAIYYWR